MQDKAEAQAAIAGGDFRTGAGIAAAGALLLASTLTELWTGPAVIPGALAVSLLVFGGYLLSLQAGLFAAGAGDRAGALRHFDGHPEPVLISDLDGRVLGANPAARRSRALQEGLAGGGARYRLTREARLNGVAIEEAEHGGRIVVTRMGPRSLLWRHERAAMAPASAPGFEHAGVPWLRIDAEGRVLERNARGGGAHRRSVRARRDPRRRAAPAGRGACARRQRPGGPRRHRPAAATAGATSCSWS